MQRLFLYVVDIEAVLVVVAVVVAVVKESGTKSTKNL